MQINRTGSLHPEEEVLHLIVFQSGKGEQSVDISASTYLTD